MWIRSIIGICFYLGLLALALIFCWQNFQNYAQGLTAYSIANEPITPKDLPTVCICLPPTNMFFPPSSMVKKYKHGVNFWISVVMLGRLNGILEFVTLRESKIVISKSGIKFHLERMDPHWRLVKKADYPFCYRIFSNWDVGSIKIGFDTEFKIDFRLRFNSGYGQRMFQVYVSSHENSYGLTAQKWFDGIVDQNAIINTRGGYLITGVDEYRSLEGICSRDSYYDCLAKKFQALDMSKLTDNKGFHTSRCKGLKVCKPKFPLPNSDQIPRCSGFTQWACSSFGLRYLMQTEATHCKKACNIIEYKLEKASNTDSLEITNDTVAVELKFDTPSSRRHSRLMLPYKTVHTEYLVTTWGCLLGFQSLAHLSG